MAELSQRYALPFIAAGQSQKEVTHNEAVNRIDTLLHLAVVSMAINTPPVDPQPGDAWIVGDNPTAEWIGHAEELASFGDGGWRFIQPAAGCLAWVVDIGVFAVRMGGGWLSDAWPVRALRIGGTDMLMPTQPAIPPVAGGAVVDVEARATLLAIISVLSSMGLIAS